MKLTRRSPLKSAEIGGGVMQARMSYAALSGSRSSQVGYGYGGILLFAEEVRVELERLAGGDSVTAETPRANVRFHIGIAGFVHPDNDEVACLVHGGTRPLLGVPLGSYSRA